MICFLVGKWHGSSFHILMWITIGSLFEDALILENKLLILFCYFVSLTLYHHHALSFFLDKFLSHEKMKNWNLPVHAHRFIARSNILKFVVTGYFHHHVKFLLAIMHLHKSTLEDTCYEVRRIDEDENVIGYSLTRRLSMHFIFYTCKYFIILLGQLHKKLFQENLIT